MGDDHDADHRDGGVSPGRAHAARRSSDARLRVVLLTPVVLCLLATIVGLLLLWPDQDRPRREHLDGAGRLVDATVLDVRRVACAGTEDLPDPVPCDGVEAEITSGERAGSTVLIRTISAGGLPDAVEVGTGIVLGEQLDAPLEFRYSLVDLQRGRPLAAILALFVVVAVVLGRWHGVRALAGLGFGLAVLVVFVLPAISSGHDPVAVAIVGGAAVAVPALYLAHGPSLGTTVALLGTFVSLTLIGLLGWLAAGAARFTGLSGEDAVSVAALTGAGDLRGLLLAGIVIGAIGVLDDVTVTQVAAVREIRRARPASTAVELYRAGVRVGREHIASTVNTLVLAYAGAALPLLLLLSETTLPFAQLITSEVVAVELVRAAVGAIGLMAAVPVTTALAATVLTGGRR